MAQTPVIQTNGLTKYYGRVRGVEDLTLGVMGGEVLGLLGPNGSGKSTTIRLLLNLLQPDRGGGRIAGMDIRRQSQQVRQVCGIVLGEPAYYEHLTGSQHLDLLQSVHRTPNKRRDEMAERFQLDLSRPIRAYSKGNKQKLAILMALAHDPDVLIMDEPSQGLDPLMQRELHDVLREEKARGKTVLLSSHILSDVQRVCDRVAVLGNGRLLTTISVQDMQHTYARRIQVTLTRDALPEDFAYPGITNVQCSGRVAELTAIGHIGPVLQKIAALPLEDVVAPEASIEDLFNLEIEGREPTP